MGAGREKAPAHEWGSHVTLGQRFQGVLLEHTFDTKAARYLVGISTGRIPRLQHAKHSPCSILQDNQACVDDGSRLCTLFLGCSHWKISESCSVHAHGEPVDVSQRKGFSGMLLLANRKGAGQMARCCRAGALYRSPERNLVARPRNGGTAALNVRVGRRFVLEHGRRPAGRVRRRSNSDSAAGLTRSGRILRRLGGLFAPQLTADARFLAVGTKIKGDSYRMGEVRIFDIAVNRLVARIESEHGIHRFKLSMDGRYLAISEEDRTRPKIDIYFHTYIVRVFNPHTGDPITKMPMDGSLPSLYFNVQGDRLAAICLHGFTVSLIDPGVGVISCLEDLSGRYSPVAVKKDASRITAIGNYSGTTRWLENPVHVWSTTSGGLVHQQGRPGGVPDSFGDYWLYSTVGKTVYHCRELTSNKVQDFRLDVEASGAPPGVLSPDNRLLACLCKDASIQVWDRQSERRLHTLPAVGVENRSFLPTTASLSLVERDSRLLSGTWIPGHGVTV